MNGMPDEQGRWLVIVPAHPPQDRDGGGRVKFELRQAADGSAVLPVFSTVARLVHELGRYQAWVCVPLQAARDAAAQAGVSTVVLDPALRGDVWRWDADRVAELSQWVLGGAR